MKLARQRKAMFINSGAYWTGCLYDALTTFIHLQYLLDSGLGHCGLNDSLVFTPRNTTNYGKFMRKYYRYKQKQNKTGIRRVDSNSFRNW